MGVSCQIRRKEPKKKERKTNPSHSLFKAANVSFEEIILFGHLIALGNYEPLQGMSGITRTGYQRGRRRPVVFFTLFFLRLIPSEESVIFGVSSTEQKFQESSEKPFLVEWQEV